jgi:hypothetical protein
MIDLNSVIPWSILILSTLGAHFTSGKSRRYRYFGFAIWAISNGMIGIRFYFIGDYVSAILFLGVYEFYNFRGIYNNREVI